MGSSVNSIISVIVTAVIYTYAGWSGVAFESLTGFATAVAITTGAVVVGSALSVKPKIRNSGLSRASRFQNIYNI